MRGGQLSAAAPFSRLRAGEPGGGEWPRHGGRRPSSPYAAGPCGGRRRPLRAASRPCSAGEAGAVGSPRAGGGAGAAPPLPGPGARGCLRTTRALGVNARCWGRAASSALPVETSPTASEVTVPPGPRVSASWFPRRSGANRLCRSLCPQIFLVIA